MINYALIGKALLHPRKQEILGAMQTAKGAMGDGVLSPNELANLLGKPLGVLSYHINDLAGRTKKSRFADSPLLELVDTAPRRGALEHYYALTEAAVIGGEGR